MDCDFLCNEIQLAALINNYKTAEQCLITAMDNANALLAELRTSECWKGNNKEAMVGFMDIIVKYHQALCGDDTILKAAENTLNELYNNSTNFCSTSSAYLEMEAL